MKLIINKHTGQARYAGPSFGRSPGAVALDAVRKQNKVSNYILSEDYHRYSTCVSFWESRKVMGWLGIFYFAHNMHCQARADQYREKIIDHIAGLMK